jgi:hypothetical protein
MRITVTSAPGRKGPVGTYWPAEDPNSPLFGDRRRWLVISAPWQMPASEILAAIADELTDEELTEVAEVLGLKEGEG